MSGANGFRAELLRRFQRLDPFAGVAVGEVVVRTVHASVAREQNSFPGQPGESVAMRVRDAQVAQLDAMTAVVENHFLRKQ